MVKESDNKKERTNTNDKKQKQIKNNIKNITKPSNT